MVAAMLRPAEARHGIRPRASRRRPGSLAPWVTFPLMLPFGLCGGYTTVALVFLLSRAGLGAAGIGSFLFVILIPQTIKFLYAPLVDLTLGPRRWYVIGTLTTAAALLALAFVPPTVAALGPLTAIGILSTFGITLVAIPADVIMAYDIAPGRKGQASGWASAANLGGGSIGGGLALWLLAHGFPVWMLPTTMAVLCLACMPFVLLVATREAFSSHLGWADGQRALLRDIWAMMRSRLGALTLLLAILPIGTGAMLNLLPAIAADWKAGADEVALVSGGIAGIVQIVGALIGGAICDRFDRRWTYCTAGMMLAAMSVAMALGPRTPAAFVGFSLVYAFILGIAYSAFTAAILQAIGTGAAASKYTLIICASNAAILAESALEGWVHDRVSVTGMLTLEAAGALVAVAIYALVDSWSRAGRRRADRVPAPAG